MLLYSLIELEKSKMTVYKACREQVALKLDDIYSDLVAAEVGSILPPSYESLVSTPYITRDGSRV